MAPPLPLPPGLNAQTPLQAGRRDGRSPLEMRPLTLSQSTLSRADGSARLRFGGTDVLVAIYGPFDCPIPRQLADNLHVNVTLRQRAPPISLADNPSAGAAHPVAARELSNIVCDVLMRSMHPRKALVVAVQVLADHGAVTSAVINATIAALLDAGVPMNSLPTAVAVSVHNDTIIVDPVRVEEMEAQALLTFTFNTALVHEKGFLSVYTQGDCAGQHIFDAALEISRQLAVKTKAFLKLSLQQKAAHPYVWNTRPLPVKS